jgi:hypothetical protein
MDLEKLPPYWKAVADEFTRLENLPALAAGQLLSARAFDEAAPPGHAPTWPSPATSRSPVTTTTRRWRSSSTMEQPSGRQGACYARHSRRHFSPHGCSTPPTAANAEHVACGVSPRHRRAAQASRRVQGHSRGSPGHRGQRALSRGCLDGDLPLRSRGHRAQVRLDTSTHQRRSRTAHTQLGRRSGRPRPIPRRHLAPSLGLRARIQLGPPQRQRLKVTAHVPGGADMHMVIKDEAFVSAAKST